MSLWYQGYPNIVTATVSQRRHHKTNIQIKYELSFVLPIRNIQRSWQRSSSSIRFSRELDLVWLSRWILILNSQIGTLQFIIIARNLPVKNDRSCLCSKTSITDYKFTWSFEHVRGCFGIKLNCRILNYSKTKSSVLNTWKIFCSTELVNCVNNYKACYVFSKSSIELLQQNTAWQKQQQV